MSIVKTNESEHCGCDDSTSGGGSVCRECGNEGKLAKALTLKSLVKKPRLETIKSLDGFYFCETPACKVVYFNNEQDVYLNKADISIRVGIKETDDPVPVCYCFGWTRKRILDQIERKGFSTAVQEISPRVKAGDCTCEVNNPAGRCCLGQVTKLVKELNSVA
ncbi:MAG: copper chaperone Copz family protein, partial [Chloroflexi bacterium]|nr:copper chaperone Copz family protein [Chloroflexota bacterium]